MRICKRLVQQWADDPFRIAENERATRTEASAWRLAARSGVVLSLLITAGGHQRWGAFVLQACHSLYCEAAALLVLKCPAQYSRWRELVCFAGWLHQAWTFSQIPFYSSNALQLHNASALWLLALLLLRNGSLWMMAYPCHARLLWSWCCLTLPCVVAVPLYYSQALCEDALLNAGMEVPLGRLYRGLAWAHIAVADQATGTWVLGITDPQHQCWMVNTWSLLMAVVALPLLLLWRLEQRARRRFLHQRRLRPADPHKLELDTRPSWATVADICLISCAAWADVCLWASARGL